jgi:hypothetical protein
MRENSEIKRSAHITNREHMVAIFIVHTTIMHERVPSEAQSRQQHKRTDHFALRFTCEVKEEIDTVSTPQ